MRHADRHAPAVARYPGLRHRRGEDPPPNTTASTVWRRGAGAWTSTRAISTLWGIGPRRCKPTARWMSRRPLRCIGTSSRRPRIWREQHLRHRLGTDGAGHRCADGDRRRNRRLVRSRCGGGVMRPDDRGSDRGGGADARADPAGRHRGVVHPEEEQRCADT